MFAKLAVFLSIFVLLEALTQTLPPLKLLSDRLHSPWHAEIIVGKCLKTKCGGIIITCNYILTSATCVSLLDHPLPPSFIDVFLSSETLNYAHKDREVVSVHLHPEFNRGVGFEHNLALLKVTPKIVYTRYLKSINLPKYPEPLDLTAVISGYPTLKKETCNMTILQSNPVKLQRHHVESVACQNITLYKMFPSESYIRCVQSVHANRTICLNDQGDAVVAKEDKNYVVYGTIVRGHCDDAPHIYVRIYPHLEWIESIIRHH